MTHAAWFAFSVLTFAAGWAGSRRVALWNLSDVRCLWFNEVGRHCDRETREKVYNGVGWFRVEPEAGREGEQ